MIFAFDLDGVIYAGDELIPAAAAAVALARSFGHRTYFISNNSRQNSVEVAARLQLLGLDAAPREVVCATEITGLVVSRLEPPPRSVLVIGSDSLAVEVGRCGAQVYRYFSDSEVDAVVMGLDFGMTYDMILAAHRAIVRHGARFIAANDDVTFASAGGSVPGCGAFVRAIQLTTGATPIIVGKPAPQMFRRILDLESAGPGELVVFGDSLYADIGGAKAIGAKAVLVLTGVDSRDGAARAPSDQRPDWIIDSLHDLPLEQLTAGS